MSAFSIIIRETLYLERRGLGKRRRSGGRFAPKKRARFNPEGEEGEDEEEDNDQLVNNNNRLRAQMVEDMRALHANIQARVVQANHANHVQLSDSDSDDVDANNAHGEGDSRFAEKVLDRTLVDKECIICYMAMEKGTCC